MSNTNKRTAYLPTYASHPSIIALASFLKMKRKEQGHTMRTLAKILELPHSFIGKYETRKLTLDAIQIIDICRALKCDPMEAFQLVVDAGGK